MCSADLFPSHDTLGKANELPFKVCANWFLPSLSLKRNFKRFAWKVSKLETELISNQRSGAVEYTSMLGLSIPTSKLRGPKA